MSRTIVSLSAIALLAAPAVAAGYGFNADYTGTPIPTIGTVNIEVAPDVVRETSSLTRQRAEDYIDPRDAEDLVADLRDELEGELSRTGAYAPMVAQPVGTLNVTIEQATPSNPAHTKAGLDRNLDFRSAGRGGATIRAELISPEGQPVAEFTYRWEESSFDVANLPRNGWYGAERAFDRFSARLARELQ